MTETCIMVSQTYCWRSSLVLFLTRGKLTEEPPEGSFRCRTLCVSYPFGRGLGCSSASELLATSWLVDCYTAYTSYGAPVVSLPMLFGSSACPRSSRLPPPPASGPGGAPTCQVPVVQAPRQGTSSRWLRRQRLLATPPAPPNPAPPRPTTLPSLLASSR